MAEIKLNIDALHDLLEVVFPQIAGQIQVVSLEPMFVRTRLAITESNLRPGGTVSGPTMFTLADVSAYIAVLSMVGNKPLCVTTSCGMDFMRKPAAGADLTCETRVLKLGRALAVMDCLIFSEGKPEPVARANMTYAIPPSKAEGV